MTTNLTDSKLLSAADLSALANWEEVDPWYAATLWVALNNNDLEFLVMSLTKFKHMQRSKAMRGALALADEKVRALELLAWKEAFNYDDKTLELKEFKRLTAELAAAKVERDSIAEFVGLDFRPNNVVGYSPSSIAGTETAKAVQWLDARVSERKMDTARAIMRELRKAELQRLMGQSEDINLPNDAAVAKVRSWFESQVRDFENVKANGMLTYKDSGDVVSEDAYNAYVANMAKALDIDTITVGR